MPVNPQEAVDLLSDLVRIESVTPWRARSSGVSERWELAALYEIVEATSPRLWTMAIMSRARKNAAASVRSPVRSNATIPPVPRG